MKRTVTITIAVDPAKYSDAQDTDDGAIDLVIAMLRDEADLPDEITIACDSVIRHTNDIYDIFDDKCDGKCDTCRCDHSKDH